MNDEEAEFGEIQQSEDVVIPGDDLEGATRFLHMSDVKQCLHPWYREKFEDVLEQISQARWQFTMWKRIDERLKRRLDGMGFVSALTLKRINEAEKNKSYWHWRLVMAGSRRNLLEAAHKRYLIKHKDDLKRIEREPAIRVDEEGVPIVPPCEDECFTTEEDISSDGDVFDPKKHGEY